MVLLDVMGLQVKTLLFKGLFVNATNEAFSFFVIDHLFSLGPQGGEVVDQDTSQYITEQHVHEDHVDHVIWEPTRFEWIHIFTDLFLDVELYHTTKHSFTVIFWIFLWVYGFDITTHRKYWEKGVERNPEEGQDTQHLDTDLQSPDDTLQHIQSRHQ